MAETASTPRVVRLLSEMAKLTSSKEELLFTCMTMVKISNLESNFCIPLLKAYEEDAEEVAKEIVNMTPFQLLMLSDKP